jgi:hypothetical protein
MTYLLAPRTTKDSQLRVKLLHVKIRQLQRISLDHTLRKLDAEANLPGQPSGLGLGLGLGVRVRG